ncbi:hypothetical protein S7711_10921 [Stachybotrys chartarum IBT 7711]|uniref:Uncharacterized protein n=1 Tax=Stachybotrys chartarum (strain CBS 109288 / IBT 7711) TaxID=1280523 RepID=A0A084ANS4_STACB|nr:hypothetical protein S7711_10921 [Stachybotrys chartarum IBT 7711]KFA47453.1 hypothetical protein S40293_10933 [Stachybotrys chartarum IBT 40293]
MLRSVLADLLQRVSAGYANHTIVDVDADRSIFHGAPRAPLPPWPAACHPFQSSFVTTTSTGTNNPHPYPTLQCKGSASWIGAAGWAG